MSLSDERVIIVVCVFPLLVISSPSLPVVITFKWNQISNDRTTLSFEFWFHFVPVGACIFGFSSSLPFYAYHCGVFDVKLVTSTGDLQKQHEYENWHSAGAVVGVASVGAVVIAS